MLLLLEEESRYVVPIVLCFFKDRELGVLLSPYGSTDPSAARLLLALEFVNWKVFSDESAFLKECYFFNGAPKAG